MSGEIATREFTGLLNVTTGELLEPNLENAAIVIDAARSMKTIVNDIVNEATAYVVQEAAVRGTKTLRSEGHEVSLSGGTSDEYDAHDLMQLLREAGCPEDRIDAAVETVITYKVNRAVLRQLAGANGDYKAAIDLARREVEKPYRVSVKLNRRNDT